jgi:cation diffusion facilitator family transporter
MKRGLSVRLFRLHIPSLPRSSIYLPLRSIRGAKAFQSHSILWKTCPTHVVSRGHKGHSHTESHRFSRGVSNEEPDHHNHTRNTELNSPTNTKLAKKVTWLGLGLNVALFVGKAAAALWGRSEALLADAVHTLSDASSDAVTLWAVSMSAPPPSTHFPYGHGRFETLGTLFVAVALLGSGVGIGYHSLETLFYGAGTIPTQLALYGAVGSILFKELLYQVTVRVGNRLRSSLLVANAWHHRSDALSSVVALVGILGAQYGYPWWDPVAGLAVSAMIAKMGFNILKDSVYELTDSARGNEETAARISSLVLGIDFSTFLSSQISPPTEVKILPKSVRIRRMGTYRVIDLQLEIDLKVHNVSLFSFAGAEKLKTAVRAQIQEAIPNVREVSIDLVVLAADPSSPIPAT